MGILWAQSGIIARDNDDIRATGAKAHFFVGGTTTPLVVYEDAGATTPHNDPVVADSNGRWPAVFIPYCTSYDVQATTSTGGQELFYFLEVPNPDPVDVAAGAVTTSSAQILQTGDFLPTPKTGTRAGFVRCNGRTIGAGASGASERANADCSDLFTFNWNNFANTILPIFDSAGVASTRGVSAAADFTANKRLSLFDGRAASFIGVDDMGNTAASGFASAPAFTTGDATTGGSVGGANAHTLTTAQLASHSHTGSVSSSGTSGTESADHTHSGTTGSINQSLEHTHTYTGNAGALTSVNGTGPNTNVGAVSAGGQVTGGSSTSSNLDHNHGFTTGNVSATHTHSLSVSGSFTTATNGSGTAHNSIHKCILGNWLQKL